jgi:hypothetical protein
MKTAGRSDSVAVEFWVQDIDFVISRRVFVAQGVEVPPQTMLNT